MQRDAGVAAAPVRAALVVDDDLALLDLLLALVREAGFINVWSATGVAAAMAGARAAPHLDLLVCDVQLAKDDGLALALRVKEWHPGARVVVISSKPLAASDVLRVSSVGRFVPKNGAFLPAIRRAIHPLEVNPSPRGEP